MAQGGVLYRRLEGVLANAAEAHGTTFRMVTVSLPSSGEPITDIKDEEAVAAEVAAHSGTAAIYGIFDLDRTTVVDRCARWAEQCQTKPSRRHASRQVGSEIRQQSPATSVCHEVWSEVLLQTLLILALQPSMRAFMLIGRQ